MARDLKKIQNCYSVCTFIQYRQIKVQLEQIEYIESLEDYIKIYLTGNPKPILTLLSLKKIQEKLPNNDFSRIHRSYVIAHRKVKSILRRKALLESGKELPISDSYLSFIEEWRKK